jgi:hypothetical protein
MISEPIALPAHSVVLSAGLFNSYNSRFKERAACDLTGLFWTRPYERIGLAKELGNAEEAI